MHMARMLAAVELMLEGAGPDDIRHALGAIHTADIVAWSVDNQAKEIATRLRAYFRGTADEAGS